MLTLRVPSLLLGCALFSGACGRLGVELLDSGEVSPVDGGELNPPGDAGAGDGTLPLEMQPCMVDSDGDGTVDCQDGCRDDRAKTAPGVCGCMVADADRDGDGILDCQDRCGGSNDAAYVGDATCGVGYCQSTNTPSSCVNSVETMCQAGAPRSATDSTCDGVDDNCNGVADENYMPVTVCGVGSCAARATPSRCATGVVTACQPAAPLASNDVTFDGVDDDCDGAVDEDACTPYTLAFGPGTYMPSAGPCKHVTVKLWGGAGAAGDAQGGFYGVAVTGGLGGPGGFTQQTFTVSAASNIRVYVGQGAQGCGTSAGTNPMASYRGGNGATALGGNGSAGSDGSVTGGAGANPSSGGRGGAGSFGGGGGAAGGGPGFAPFGAGGGGGAASVATIDSARLVAGGGGGGGGAGSNGAGLGFNGGNGGSGCAGPGASTSSEGGGGAGGGVCQGGASSQRGTGRAPYDAANELPGGTATGGSGSTDCQAGGNGYAILSFSP